MSVDYGTEIFRGWRMTVEQQERFNEITDYEYEDCFTRPNFYREGNDVYNPVFFGDTIASLGTGNWANVQEYQDPDLIYNRNGVCSEAISLSVMLTSHGDYDLAEIFSTLPNIFIISQVS